MNRFLLAGGLLLAPASLAFAASCNFISGGATINPGTITVQRDVAVGESLSDYFFVSIVPAFRDCEFNSESPTWRAVGLLSANTFSSGLSYQGHRVFDTNLPGVGMIIIGEASIDTDLSNKSPLVGIYSGQREVVFWTQDVIKGTLFQASARVGIRLIKTGTISGGTLSGNIGRFFNRIRTQHVLPDVPITFSGGSIRVVSCSVTTPNISVPLGKQAKSSFKGVGSGTEWQSFDIQLNCIKGARINVRLDATAAPATTRKDIMRLDPESGDIAAKGVGIQIGYRMGYELELGKTLLYETSKFDTEFILLRARYYQTEENVIAGKANGTATFTLTYK
ncbi:fimbrial protein [Enterobacter sp. KBR-315C3_2022]|uniref:fimbrial protein n=1 Tax=Enterobacter sp. KBR-315C3_2022 TaxID=3242494 RepID=UPI00352726F8